MVAELAIPNLLLEVTLTLKGDLTIDIKDSLTGSALDGIAC
jgi:hypothetical protein